MCCTISMYSLLLFLAMSSSSPTASLGFSGDTKRPHSSPSNKLLSTGFVVRTKSESASSRHHLRQSSGDSVSGIIFAVKHWICKHYQVSCTIVNST